MKRKFILTFAFSILAQTVLAEWSLTDVQKREIAELAKETNMTPQLREQYTMIVYVNYKNLAYRTAVLQKMVEEANFFADKLQLPTKRPIQITDIKYPHITAAWFNVIRETSNRDYLPDTIFSNRVYDANIPREERLRALKFGTDGTIETTNFFFSFQRGKLWDVERLSEHAVEYYARNLDELVGKPSLIDTNGAYQLATQWLAAVDVDVAALEKASGPLIKGGHSINQLHYLVQGATNAVTLPLFYVDFGSKHYPASDNLKAFDKPLVSVEVLGTMKELQELEINDPSFSHRPLLLITNALDLICTPDPPVKHLERALSSPSLNSTGRIIPK